MTTMFSSILLPLDSSSNAVRPLRTAAWLADKLNSRLHVLTATSKPEPAATALERLKVPPDLGKQLVLHQLGGHADVAILQTMDELQTDLLVISALGEGEAASGGNLRLGHVVRAVLQQTDVPVLLVPPAFTERLPMRSAVIPVSGQQDTDAALDLAVRLANSLQLNLQVTHVISPEADEADYTSGLRYPDSVHHEYAGRLSDMLRRACPQCSPEDFERVVEKVCLCRGAVADELLNTVEQTAVDLMVVGWHGKLQPGRSRFIKELIAKVSCPILLFARAPRRILLSM